MTISCVAVADSTGGGVTFHQGAKAAEIVLDRKRHRLSVISPGAALCSPGQGSQPSLASLIADPYQAFGTTEAKRSLQKLLEENRTVKVIFVKAEDSIPWTTSIAKRYKAMVQYRKDLTV